MGKKTKFLGCLPQFNGLSLAPFDDFSSAWKWRTLIRINCADFDRYGKSMKILQINVHNWNVYLQTSMRLQTMAVGTLDQDSPQSDMSSTNPQFVFYIISLPLIVNDSDSYVIVIQCLSAQKKSNR
jgi:hypothetical protein